MGRRIAFDEWKGRLWVVCPHCARWNLTPLDDRLERIEAVARAAAEGRLIASTEHVALIRWQRYAFVRVGRPPRVELAPWRYGERLREAEEIAGIADGALSTTPELEAQLERLRRKGGSQPDG